MVSLASQHHPVLLHAVPNKMPVSLAAEFCSMLKTLHRNFILHR